MIWIILSSIGAGVVGIAWLIHSLKKGQFEEIEDVKYQMFHDEDDE